MRSAAQLLHRPRSPSHPADIAREIAGVQAQDPRAGRLAFRARQERLTAADVDRARTEERSLLRTWAMRKTAHLLPSDDAPWLLPLFEPEIEKWSRRRLGQLGMDARSVERSQETIRRALAADGPLTRAQLGDRLEKRKIMLGPETRAHVFGLAVTSGLAYQGPDRGAQPCLVLRQDWLPEPTAHHDRDAALRELARRYLTAFGPTTEADFAGWAGLPLRDIRVGLNGIAPELRELRIGELTAVSLKRPARRAGGPVIRLLPAFDTFLMGYRDRDFIAGAERWPAIGPGGGVLNPVLVRDGEALGTWKMPTAARREIELEPFERLDATTRRALEAEIADVARFEGA
jgi:Winged helix DNA-binding domain